MRREVVVIGRVKVRRHPRFFRPDNQDTDSGGYRYPAFKFRYRLFRNGGDNLVKTLRVRGRILQSRR